MSVSKFIVYGVYYGYSEESILAFIDRAEAITADLTSKGQIDERFSGSGYISPICDADRSVEDIIVEINRRRFCKIPFSITGTPFETNKDFLIKELIEKNENFLNIVIRIVNLYKRRKLNSKVRQRGTRNK